MKFRDFIMVFLCLSAAHGALAQGAANLRFLEGAVWRMEYRCVGDSCEGFSELEVECYRFLPDTFACPGLGSPFSYRMERYVLSADPITADRQFVRSSCPDYLGFPQPAADSTWEIIVCGEHWPYIAELTRTAAGIIELNRWIETGSPERLIYGIIKDPGLPLMDSPHSR